MKTPLRVLAGFVAVCLLVGLSARADDIRIDKDDRMVTVTADGKTVMKYRYGDGPFRPYVIELYTPGGVQILRDSPPDHVHHRALMFAIGVDGVDFWGETAKCGKQTHQALEPVVSSKLNGWSSTRLCQKLDWRDAEGKSMLRETRTLCVIRQADLGATLLSWHTTLSAPEDQASAKLDGRHYFGLGMRFVVSMDQEGTMLNAAGKEGEAVRGSEQLVPAKWVAYSAAADGKPVTAALFDHPSNPRHPAHMFTMTKPFAYLSATLNLKKESLEIKAGQPLHLSYGVAVWDGSQSAEQIEKLYQRWLALEK